MSNTATVITTKAGEALIAKMQAENKVLVIDKFIFANVPNRPAFPNRDDVVPTEHVVHESAVHEQGRLTENSVIYSTTLASHVGPFSFNWSGLFCSEHNVLVAINFPPPVDKTVDEPGITGNTLVRSFVLEYKGIAETTNITVDPSSWQYDAHKRMSKMDNDTAQAIIDQNGKDWFIDDGFIVTQQSSAYSVKAGAGYVSGHRITLDFDRTIQVPEKPAFIYVDAEREGSPTGEWVTKFNFVVSPDEKDDYTDAQGVKHFVCKIAQVMGDGSVGDLRKKNTAEINSNILIDELDGLKIHPAKLTEIAVVGDQVCAGVNAVRLNLDSKNKIFLLHAAVPESGGISEINTIEKYVIINDVKFYFFPKKQKITSAKSFGLYLNNTFVENQIVETEGYYTQGDGGSAIYVLSGSVPADGYGNISVGNLTAVIISSPTDKNHGVLTSESFDPAIALNNRAAIEAMLRNRRFNHFELISNGDVHIIGSIHPLRSNIKIRHDKACNIKGYLSDPSTSQVSAGHIFGFPIYKDPDNAEYEIVEQCVGVEYELEGDIASIYRDVHVKPHNNNCIGFYNAKSCYVVGSGGVSESDHKGVTFDGDAVDCHLDIGYINNTSNEPWQMKGNGTDERYTNTVRVGVIENPKFNGNNAKVVGFVSDCDLCIVRIGSYVGDKSVNPVLVSAFGCNKVIVKETYCENVSQILRQYDTAHGEVFDVNYKNVDSVVRRAGAQVGVNKSTSIKRVICKGGEASAAYHSEVTHSKFDRLIIRDCDFSAVSTPGDFELYKGQATASLPNNMDISGNETPEGYDSTRQPNMSYGLSGKLISGTPHSFTYNVYEPDFRYTKMSLQILPMSGQGIRKQIETNLRSLVVSSQTYHLMIGTDEYIECVNVSGVLTFTAPDGYNFSWVEASN
ncbi:phage tail-collar fiber domain-containing protein [Photobacterium leiognathi]|uniref:phage tail-collar fiber domain-containing protein n=1 Tax=Photobacterium leiognathi TaxID=553611 RepID=UPI0029818BDD|nr:phage tail protein [Photobacterium leiognathi]